MGIRLSLLAVIIVFIFFSCKSVPIPKELLESKWKLEISFEKDTFLLREPIWLDATLTNPTDDTLRSWGLWPPCIGYGFDIKLTDSTDNPVPYSGPMICGIPGPGFLIYPNEQYYNCFNLIDLFALHSLRHHFDAQSPGRYFVQGVYGGTFSNKISFTVVDPKGKEKEAEQSFLDAFGAPLDRPVDSDKVVQLRMLESYPNSVYAELAAIRLLQYNKFLYRFPNSGHTRSRLTGDMIGLTDEEKIEYLESAIVKYQGTRAARHAQQLLILQRK